MSHSRSSTRPRCRLIRLAALLAISLSGSVLAQTTPTFDIDQAVEVREGDAWSKASIVAKEGRRFQIKYDDGTLEWVTADRLRAPTRAGEAKPADPAKPARPKIVWQVNQQVEVKWGGLWSKATIANRRGEWLLVQYDQGRRKEWVEPWRIRKVGDSTDVPYASPNPVVHNAEGPPRDKPGEPPETSQRTKADDPFGPEKFDFTVTPTNTGGVTLVAASGEVKWTYKPAAVPPVAASMVSKGPLQQGAEITCLGVEDGNILIGYALDRGSDKGSSVEWFDKTARRQVQIKIDKASRPVALLPGGRLLAQAAGFFHGTRHRVDVWKLAAAPEHEISFVPYPNGGTPSDLDTLLAIDADHLLTTSGPTVTAWQIADAKALWQTTASTTASLALSPDRKTVAIGTGDEVLLLEALTGNPLGTIASPAGALSELTFSPTGKRLFALAGGSIVVFDLEKGVYVTSVATSRPANQLLALSDRLVDAGDCVIDVEAPAAVARLVRGPTRPVGSSIVSIADGTLFSLALPIKSLEDLKASTSKVISLKPGTPITLDLSINSPEADAVAEALRTNLARQGIRLGDGADLRLLVRTEDGKSEERLYEEMAGRMLERERLKVTVVERITRIWLEQQGRILWERRVSAWPPMTVSRKEGQSLPDAVAAANVPSVDWLRTVTLPAAVIDLDGVDLPRKKLVPTGVR